MKTAPVAAKTEVIPLELARMEIGTEIMPPFAAGSLTRSVTFAVRRLKGLWRSAVAHTGNKHKALSVRETAALGDRRFVSVIQFERQRYLIGSSPAAITLLAQLPDESRAESGERN